MEEDLIKKFLTLVEEGRSEFKTIFEKFDFKNLDHKKKARAILNAKKGAYSRKLFEFVKFEYTLRLLEVNNIPIRYKVLTEVCIEIFGEGVSKKAFSDVKKDEKYGTGAQQKIFFNADEIDRHKLNIDTMYLPYREKLLDYLSYGYDETTGASWLNFEFDKSKYKKAKKTKL